MNDRSPNRPDESQSLTEAFDEASRQRHADSELGLFAYVFIGVSIFAVIMGGAAVVDTMHASSPPAAPDTTVVSEVNYSSVYDNVSTSTVSVYANNASGSSSQGSGFVYDDQGHIVTNWHVVNGVQDAYVRYENDEWANATVVGVDPYTDLAVLRVDYRPDEATPVPVRDAENSIGERVLAVGSPNDMRGSLTTGVVSGLNRSMTTPRGYVIPDMVQTEASLNPGNSGGPLVRMDGAVVGVNRARQGENLGFAISGPVVNTVVPSLIDNGQHQHPRMGIKGTTMGPATASANNVALQSGVLVTQVAENGPTNDTLEGGDGSKIMHDGYEVFSGGDILVAVDGEPVPTNERLTSYLIQNKRPGDTASLTVVRDGQRETVTVTLGQRPVYGTD